MQTIKLFKKSARWLVAVAIACGLSACQSGTGASHNNATDAKASAAKPAAAAPASAPASAPAAQLPSAIRIKAGSAAGFKDAEGNQWLPDQGFDGGDVVERPDLEIANTKTPTIYRSERYSMTGFSYSVPNGKYIVKLHFAETFEGIAGPGQRVFSFKVGGQEFKDFDVWVKAGGPQRAYVETVHTQVDHGKIEISFTPNVENPQINGIEIIPEQ